MYDKQIKSAHNVDLQAGDMPQVKKLELRKANVYVQSKN